MTRRSLPDGHATCLHCSGDRRLTDGAGNHLLSYRQAVKLLGLKSLTELQRGVRKGEIRQHLIDGQRGFDPNEVEAWSWTLRRRAEERGYIRGVAQAIGLMVRWNGDEALLAESMKTLELSSLKARLAGLDEFDVAPLLHLETKRSESMS